MKNLRPILSVRLKEGSALERYLKAATDQTTTAALHALAESYEDVIERGLELADQHDRNEP